MQAAKRIAFIMNSGISEHNRDYVKNDKDVPNLYAPNQLVKCF